MVLAIILALTAALCIWQFIASSQKAYAADGDLALEVNYPTTIKCNTPITFTFTPVNGSGPIDSTVEFTDAQGRYYPNHARFEYLLNAIELQQLDPETGNRPYSNEVDPTRFSYNGDRSFSYTFLTSGNYHLRFYVMDYGSLPLRTARKDVYITINDPSAPSIETVAASIADDCNRQSFTTEYEKALYMHDRIINNAVYDNSLVYMGASGVLLRGTGTCESYHRAFALLLGQVGINCYRAEGNGHVWSCVKLDGEWTQIDVTWDGECHTNDLAYQDHLYFGVTDEMMKLVHNQHTPVAARPCTSFERNYFIRSGEITTWSDPLKAQIESKVKDGQTSFNVPATYSSYPGVYRIIYPLAAYWLNKGNLTVEGKRVTVEFVPVGNNDSGSLQGSYFKVTATDASVPSQPMVKSIPMYRLYNPNSGEHFYTASTVERGDLVGVGWKYEGVGWNAPSQSTTPVYRLYSGTDHHYTSSTRERDDLVRVGWRYEGVGWYSDDAMGVPLYRQFNPNVQPWASFNNSGSHNYTTSKVENDDLVRAGWHAEGIGWYGCKQ